MTIEQLIRDVIRERGLTGRALDQAMEAVKADSLLVATQGRWDKPMEDFPQAFLVTTIIGAKRAVVKWLDATSPGSPLRSKFEFEPGGKS